jgi:hypothetical protein
MRLAGLEDPMEWSQQPASVEVGNNVNQGSAEDIRSGQTSRGLEP